jgi:hypothetical protein
MNTIVHAFLICFKYAHVTRTQPFHPSSFDRPNKADLSGKECTIYKRTFLKEA